jgi:hypothetical protein
LLAMKYVWEHTYAFFDKDVLWDMYRPFLTKEMNVKNIPDLADRSTKNSVSYYAVKKLNPRVKGNILPEGKWNIEILSQK